MRELDFLYNIPTLNNNDNKDTIWNDLYGSINISKYDVENGAEYSLTDDQKDPKRVVVFKEKVNQHKDLKNYYNDTVFKKNKMINNPYMSLITEFGLKGFEAVKLYPADFAYLTELGVYPLNRLWILRRYRDGVTIPDNLLETKEFPISTVVGWVSQEDDDFFDINFNEEWTVTNDRIDEVLSKVMDTEFKFNTKTVIPVAGWGQAILLGFLKEMGMSNFGYDEVPFGNPNVLQEGATRVTDPSSTSYGLKSGLSLTLKTSYEQKFIGDVDPGSAMLDIIRNLTKMGTSDVMYFAPRDAKIFKDIRDANNARTSINKWWTVIKTLMKAFINAIISLVKTASDMVFKKPTETKNQNGGSSTSANTADTSTTSTKILDIVSDITNSVAGTILASTMAKWKWPLIGGLGVMTGENTTPWHLTIGNPYSPFVSMGNIKVEKVNLKFNNELGYNDMPTRLNVSITASLGRNIGAQEIFAMFNNGYKRVYSKPDKKGENGQYHSLSKYYKIVKPGGGENSASNDNMKMGDIK